jgi:hypothetical protein
MVRHADLERCAVRNHVGTRTDAHELAERHDQDFVIPEAHDFGQNRLGRALV